MNTIGSFFTTGIVDAGGAASGNDTYIGSVYLPTGLFIYEARVNFEIGEYERILKIKETAYWNEDNINVEITNTRNVFVNLSSFLYVTAAEGMTISLYAQQTSGSDKTVSGYINALRIK